MNKASQQPTLELRRISKSFGKNLIFKNVNLAIQPQAILSIVGPSGVGKTTLLRTILGLEDVDQGEFFLRGAAFNPLDHSQNQVGAVFQDFRLFPHLNVLQNITLAAVQVQKKSTTEAQEAAEKLLTSLQLLEQKDKYPFQLSGGQKQRVAIARALILKPQVLCYDEPTSALDAASKWQVADLLEQFQASGMTQLVVTHDAEFAKRISNQIFTLGGQ
ncbi:amino acid ABC transporter ATP-binding protein [Lactobacillus sp. DCY120]|uniref:Amino acid ABC transporter ATP-binding protein n=1 Tax=Bombilactobacillus apium TaxID=2675299 RepID=A0A850R4A1_9LACO|nr:ATP-binding cassette domain-containing protein [Bombilactobacillus apium]NVY95667.1 amino acid ABC transporter ATP-binding protein [Bombilactobacillus apium]